MRSAAAFVLVFIAVATALDDYKFCYRYDKVCAGHDIARKDDVSQSFCERACIFHPECKSIKFWRNSKCWIKSQACSADQLNDLSDAVDAFIIKSTDQCQNYLAGDVVPALPPRPDTTNAPPMK